MIDISNLTTASEEMLAGDAYCPPEDPKDLKVILAKQLESQGHKVFCVGRGLLTIERTDYLDTIPKVCNGWGVMKISIYSDPSVSTKFEPETILYVEVGRWGLSSLKKENQGAIETIFSK